MLPLVGRRIPIVADEYADPELGSGAVKITPAHDFNDFEVGVRHSLEPINIFTTQAKINGYAPKEYRGLDRFEARDKVLGRSARPIGARARGSRTRRSWCPTTKRPSRSSSSPT